MAGGEKAKSSGEYGEKIVGNLLEYIGWDINDDGVTVPCVHTEKHSKEGKESKKHGIDYVYQYKSPLRDFTRQDILISVKCRASYPKKEETFKKTFKEFYGDLVNAAECYPASPIYSRKMPQTKKKFPSGVIFWIDRDREDGKEYVSITDKVASVRMQEHNVFESLALVDNNRAQFLYESLTFVRNKYGKENIEFFYIDTGLNNSNLEKVYSGSVMPVEYMCSDILPLTITYHDNKLLFLVVKDKFDKDYFKRIIGLSQDLTRNWASEIIIAFPDYNEFEHKELCSEAKMEFNDNRFTKIISVTTYLPDFRDGV
jgi:hypothetical protein